MTRGEHEAVAVEPLAVLRVVRHRFAVNHVAHRGAAHRETRVTGVALVDGIDRQETDRVDAVVHRLGGHTLRGGDRGLRDNLTARGAAGLDLGAELGAVGDERRGERGVGGHRGNYERVFRSRVRECDDRKAANARENAHATRSGRVDDVRVRRWVPYRGKFTHSTSWGFARMTEGRSDDASSQHCPGCSEGGVFFSEQWIHDGIKRMCST